MAEVVQATLDAPRNVAHQMASLDHMIDYTRINKGHYNSPPKWDRLTRAAIRATKLTNGTLIHESDCKDCKRKLLRLVCIFRFSDAALAARNDQCKQCGRALVKQISPSSGQEAELLRHKLEQLDWNQTLALAKNGRIGLAGLGMLRRGSLQPEMPGMERKTSSKALMEAAEVLSEVVQEAVEEELSMLPPGMKKKFTLLDQLKEDEPRIQQLIQEIREKNQVLYNLPGPLPIDETDAARKIQEAEMRQKNNYRRTRKGVGLPPSQSTKELETVNERRLSQSSWGSAYSSRHGSLEPSPTNSRIPSNFPSPTTSNRGSRHNSIHEAPIVAASHNGPRILTADMLLKEALGVPSREVRTLLPLPGPSSSPSGTKSAQERSRATTKERGSTGSKSVPEGMRGPAIVTMTAQDLPHSRSVDSSHYHRGPGFVSDLGLSLLNQSTVRAVRRLSQQFLQEEAPANAAERERKKSLIKESSAASRETVNILREHTTGKFVREHNGSGSTAPKLVQQHAGDFQGTRFMGSGAGGRGLIKERSNSGVGLAVAPRQLEREDSLTESPFKVELRPEPLERPRKASTSHAAVRPATNMEGGVQALHAPQLRRGTRGAKKHLQNLSSGIRGGGIRQQPRQHALCMPAKTELVMAQSVLHLPSLAPSRAAPRSSAGPDPTAWSLSVNGGNVPVLKVGAAQVMAAPSRGA